MGTTAQSFEVRGRRPASVATALRNTVQSLGGVGGALVFVSGALEQKLLDVARAIADSAVRAPVVVAAGTGVLTERGELEEQDAATGMVWRGGEASVAALKTSAHDVELGQSLAAWLRVLAAPEHGTTFLFARPEGFTPETFGPLRDAVTLPSACGAGTVGAHGVSAVTVEGEVLEGNVVAMMLDRGARPIIKSAHPCRYLTPLLPITEARGSLVVEIDGRPALDVLSEAGESVRGKQLVMTILGASDADEDGTSPVLIRGVQGVDPGRGALMISAEVAHAKRIAFAVRDPAKSRTELTTRLREAARDGAGAAPEFALYFNCSGRGESMYGTSGVDCRIIGDRFPRIPVCGLNSAFEIAPYEGGPALQLYNGVFVLFSSPS